jgi:hypothetical protein
LKRRWVLNPVRLYHCAGEHSGRRPSGRQPLHCTSAAYNWYFLFPFLSPKFTIAAGTVAAFLYIKKSTSPFASRVRKRRR